MSTHEPSAAPAAVPMVPLRRWLLAVGLLGLNLMDVVVTKAILRHGGVETNPIMAPIIEHPVYPVLLKLVVTLGVGILLLASPVESKFADRAVFVVVVVYVLIMGWNFGILAQASGLTPPS